MAVAVIVASNLQGSYQCSDTTVLAERAVLVTHLLELIKYYRIRSYVAKQFFIGSLSSICSTLSKVHTSCSCIALSQSYSVKQNNVQKDKKRICTVTLREQRRIQIKASDQLSVFS